MSFSPSEGPGAVSGEGSDLPVCQAVCGGPDHVHGGDARHHDQTAARPHRQAHAHLGNRRHGFTHAGVPVQ